MSYDFYHHKFKFWKLSMLSWWHYIMILYQKIQENLGFNVFKYQKLSTRCPMFFSIIHLKPFIIPKALVLNSNILKIRLYLTPKKPPFSLRLIQLKGHSCYSNLTLKTIFETSAFLLLSSIPLSLSLCLLPSSVHRHPSTGTMYYP